MTSNLILVAKPPAMQGEHFNGTSLNQDSILDNDPKQANPTQPNPIFGSFIRICYNWVTMVMLSHDKVRLELTK